MIRSLGLFLLVAAVIGLAWRSLGTPVLIPAPPGASTKLTCMSYAPFHGEQAPFSPHLHIPDRQIDKDLERLAQTTGCIRTYSARGAHGRVAAYAAKHGLAVMQGIWLNRNRAENRREIEAALRLVRRHPGTIKALIVGNEVLLRGELSLAGVKSYLEEVGRRSALPVTYADVWEFWLKARALAPATDFVTVHILPYWEDKPVAAADAVQHVRDVIGKAAAAFPGKEIWVGEVGWPSRGRMREGALPSPVNQARFVGGLTAAAAAENWNFNLVEAFDQPWKRALEGTVGGYWGVYDGVHRGPKFRLGEPLSNHPDWLLKAALGVGAAFLVFLSFWLGRRIAKRKPEWPGDLACAAIALPSGLLFGLAVTNLPIEGEIPPDRLRGALMAVLALVVPMAAAFALARGDRLEGFARALHPLSWKHGSRVEVVLALLLAATFVAAMHVALGLVFDPRYKDFPFAVLIGPVTAFAILAFMQRKPAPPKPGAAEIVAALLLAGAALFIAVNETIANWQALLLAGLLLLLAATCWRAPAAPG
ncbi:MAG TPA: beta-1,6-glucan synthase [Methyloceanibacter sp.]|nr:beta-1,6-glucan synthase [Methyloceanibacter sp.]